MSLLPTTYREVYSEDEAEYPLLLSGRTGLLPISVVESERMRNASSEALPGHSPYSLGSVEDSRSAERRPREVTLGPAASVEGVHDPQVSTGQLADQQESSIRGNRREFLCNRNIGPGRRGHKEDDFDFPQAGALPNRPTMLPQSTQTRPRPALPEVTSSTRPT